MSVRRGGTSTILAYDGAAKAPERRKGALSPCRGGGKAFLPASVGSFARRKATGRLCRSGRVSFRARRGEEGGRLHEETARGKRKGRNGRRFRGGRRAPENAGNAAFMRACLPRKSRLRRLRGAPAGKGPCRALSAGRGRAFHCPGQSAGSSVRGRQSSMPNMARHRLRPLFVRKMRSRAARTAFSLS